MFGKIIDWWRARQFQKQRLLFHYHDGEKIRVGDPYRIWREIQYAEDVDVNSLLKALDDNKGKEPETSQLIELLTKAFGIKRLNPETNTGLTDWEIIGLLGELNNYLDAVKKKFDPGPTLPQPTA